MADFTPRKPEIQLYWDSKDVEKFDFKDRSKSSGLWISRDQDTGEERLTQSGQQQLSATKGDRKFRAFIAEGWKLVKIDAEDDQQEEPDW